MKNFKLKVCGMREEENLRQLLSLQPDWVGFIFYEKSPRFALPYLKNNRTLLEMPSSQKVAVFVNESVENSLAITDLFQMGVVQLHGQEPPSVCQVLKAHGLTVFKAVGIDENVDFKQLEKYQHVVDYFVFDTKGKQEGGNGVSFDWNLLESYRLSTPFLLSGGIGWESIDALKRFSHPQCVGIDVNSRFEVCPAFKNIDLLNNFLCAFNV